MVLLKTFSYRISTIQCFKLANHLVLPSQVIVKFIRKKKILKENWLDDAEFGRVPSEIVMLLRFSHPNIVKVRRSSQ